MAPLQSLSALHDCADDPSLRYVNRMRQAVRVLYGSASPSDAFLSASLQMKTLDIQAFLRTVANNAAHAGIASVQFDGQPGALIVKADEYSLEDVVTHVLSNADRYRAAQTPIRMTLRAVAAAAEVRIHNCGPQISAATLGKVFEYGVSDADCSAAGSHRGQGLFVAKTYMAKMGGTIEAVNVDDGVEFVLKLAVA
jgi:K+-sensing histidine kinase KdpD